MSRTGRKKGYLLTIEGIDGTGKTTQVTLVAEYLRKQGYRVYETREPSSGKIGRFLREVLQDKTSIPMADALLFAADRVDHCYREILPHLDAGEIVVCDRYIASSIAYQTAHDARISRSWVEAINQYALAPDGVVILDMDPRDALRRRQMETAPTQLEKFEESAMQERTRDAYIQICARHDWIHVSMVDAALPIANVTQNICDVVIPWLCERGYGISPKS